jgi:hypothetical protein
LRSKELKTGQTAHASIVSRQRIDRAIGWRHDKALVIHAPAAVVLGHIDLIVILDRAAETELQRDCFTDVKLSLV